MGDLSGLSTFVVRLAWGDTGWLGGIVERVRSGKKMSICAIADIGQAIAQMIQEDRERTDSLSVGAEEGLHEDP
jgi:hypothetical protein